MVDDDAPDPSDSNEPAQAPNPDDSFEFNLDIRKIVISAFVVWQVIAVVIWLLPERTPRFLALPLVAGYMEFTGCWQQWSMFSPNPATLDAYVGVKIDCADGTHRYWKFPEMSTLSYVRRYQQERFRKAIENTEVPEASRMYPYLARYAAIVNASSDPRKYPMTVYLVRNYRYVPPPPWSLLQYSSHVIYTQKFSANPVKTSAI